jgi:hypothetical protein
LYLLGGEVKTKRRTEITVETDRFIVIRRRIGSPPARCAVCEGQVKMVTPDEAALLARVTSRTVYRWIEADKLHFAETSEGQLFVCLNSLLEQSSEGGYFDERYRT